MFHQTLWEAEGDITNLEIQAAQGKRFRDAQIELLRRVTGHPKTKLRENIERDHYLTADEAKKYGLIDSILKFKNLKGSGTTRKSTTSRRSTRTRKST